MRLVSKVLETGARGVRSDGADLAAMVTFLVRNEESRINTEVFSVSMAITLVVSRTLLV